MISPARHRLCRPSRQKMLCSRLPCVLGMAEPHHGQKGRLRLWPRRGVCWPLPRIDAKIISRTRQINASSIRPFDEASVTAARHSDSSDSRRVPDRRTSRGSRSSSISRHLAAKVTAARATRANNSLLRDTLLLVQERPVAVCVLYRTLSAFYLATLRNMFDAS